MDFYYETEHADKWLSDKRIEMKLWHKRCSGVAVALPAFILFMYVLPARATTEETEPVV